MADAFLGEIRLFPFAFAPKGWAKCDGTQMQVSQNTALFSLIGAYYGTDNRTWFNLPDLRGRTMISESTSGATNPGSIYQMGNAGGAENASVNVSQIPMHNHQINTVSAVGLKAVPTNRYFASSAANLPMYAPRGTNAPTPMSPNVLGVAGGDQAHNNMQPFLVLNFCIAIEGFYPPRN